MALAARIATRASFDREVGVCADDVVMTSQRSSSLPPSHVPQISFNRCQFKCPLDNQMLFYVQKLTPTATTMGPDEVSLEVHCIHSDRHS